MLDIIQIPSLQDNYIYLLHDRDSKETAVVDPALAAPVLKCLQHLSGRLKYILNTHQHWDHIGGNPEIQQATHCQIVCSHYDQARIANADITVQQGDSLSLGKYSIQILETPGHTLGHIAYYLADQAALFCGDTLFGLGCGRLFEGTAAQLWQSLQKITALPPETLIYCAHEYTEANSRFVSSIIPLQPALKKHCLRVKEMRQQKIATVPLRLAEELAYNPFLRADQEDVQIALNMQGRAAVEVFTTLRSLKDQFTS